MKNLKSVCKVAKVTVCVFISVHPFCVSYTSTFHLSVAWNPEPAGRIYVSFSLMRFCSKICPENSHLVKIGQKN